MALASLSLPDLMACIACTLLGGLIGGVGYLTTASKWPRAQAWLWGLLPLGFACVFGGFALLDQAEGGAEAMDWIRLAGEALMLIGLISILVFTSWYHLLRLIYPLDSPPRAGGIRVRRRDIAIASAALSLTVASPIGIVLYMVGAVSAVSLATVLSAVSLATVVSIAAWAFTFPIAYSTLSRWLRRRGGLPSAQQ